MNSKAGIFLAWLLILFILQLETISGQETIPNLTGIWDRNDDYGYNDTIFVNQIGNEFTGTTDGTCWLDPYNRVEGTQYAPYKEIFRGKLIGNTGKGQIVSCFPEERTIKMTGMNLTVSENGKRMDIYGGLPDNVFYEQRTFVSGLPADILIELHTSKPVYNFHEQIDVVGQIKNLANGMNTLFLEVYGPDGKRALHRDVSINPDGTFNYSFVLDNKTNNGTYLTHVAYATASKEISFDYGIPIGGIYQPMIASGIGIAAAVVGGFLLHKHGIIKRITDSFRDEGNSDQGHDLPPIIYVGVECGLENPELPKKSDFRNAIGPDLARLEQGFSKAVDDILKNRKVIKNVQKDIDFIKWCKEAKENPNKILSKVSDDIINKFLSSISPYFSNLILSELSVESDVPATRDRHKSIKKSVQFNLAPIEPYIEFVLYVNTQRVSSVKFIFIIETNVEVKNLAVNMTRTKTSSEEELQKELEQNYDKKISIESIMFKIAVEFSSLKIGPLEKDIDPPIIIGTKEMKVKNFG